MGSPGEIHDTLLDVRSFREELQQRNAFSRGKNEAASEGLYSTPVRLFIFLALLSVMTFLSGSLLRMNMHHIQRPLIQESHTPGHLRIKVGMEDKTTALVTPWTHNKGLHEAVVALKKIAESPGELQAYQQMPETGKQILLQRKQDAHKGAATERTEQASTCKSLEAAYIPLVERALLPFQAGLSQEKLASQSHGPAAIAYIKNGIFFLDTRNGELEHPMTQLWALYLFHLSQKVDLPDVTLPLNADDFAVGGRGCWFSFCRRPRLQNDLLLPNTLEDSLFFTIPEHTLSSPENDTRADAAVWLGRPMAWNRGYRRAILEASRSHPEKIYAGLTDWKGVVGLDDLSDERLTDYFKPYLSVEKWASQFKYVINVPGNCGSARLAYQLYDNAVVFLVSSEDEEWYTPLLKPYVHYVPVVVHDDGSTNVLEQILWADENPEKARQISDSALEFAVKHLAPGSGRDCYSSLLLSEFSKLLGNQTLELPTGIEAFHPDSLG